MRYTIPLASELVDELIPFWASIFGDELPEINRQLLLGAEAAHSRTALYLRRESGQLAGTALIMHSLSVPALAGLGEVATDPRRRGQGIATELCAQAIEEFRAAGGEACFLGTVNPAAARIYHRLGWRKLAGANVMVNITCGASPEEFLVDYFRRPGAVTVGRAGPDVRVAMIPLILTPHDSKVLDTNVGLYSCRYVVQNSCMGLYPRYMRHLKEAHDAFFAARTEDGRVVGLATARFDSQDRCQVDGFVHRSFAQTWGDLLKAACQWGREKGAVTLQALALVEDEEKQTLFEELGFVRAGMGQNFAVDGRSVGSWQMIAQMA